MITSDMGQPDDRACKGACRGVGSGCKPARVQHGRLRGPSDDDHGWRLVGLHQLNRDGVGGCDLAAAQLGYLAHGRSGPPFAWFVDLLARQLLPLLAGTLDLDLDLDLGYRLQSSTSSSRGQSQLTESILVEVVLRAVGPLGGGAVD